MVEATIDDLMADAAHLGMQHVTMPIEIFHLARAFADLPDKQATYAHAKPYLAGHSNAFVRRVFFTMVRFMETSAIAPEEIAAVVSAGLRDPAPWVQYDAAWVAADYRTNTPEIVEMLTRLARVHRANDDVDPSDADANLARRAAETLRVLELG